MNTKMVALAAVAAMTLAGCTEKEADEKSAFIGSSDIQVEDGAMSPEVLLSLGRLSDPTLSPDGRWILYGVSYTSIEDNRSCRNLFLQEVVKAEDGTLSFGEKVPLTKEGRSVSNARWSLDGKSIYYLQGGQVWTAGVSFPEGGKAAGLKDAV